MPHERITPALVMCIECAGLGEVEVLVEPKKTCKVCGGSGRVIEGGNPEVIKLRAENERLREACVGLRETMESAASELNYALRSNKSEQVKKHYVENAERYIKRALRGEME